MALTHEIIEKLSTLVTAGFGLVAAFAWNDAIKAIFSKYYSAGEAIPEKVTYALTVTIIAVVITVYLGKAAQKAKQADINDIMKLAELGKRIKLPSLRRAQKLTEPIRNKQN